jgi:hypothetical protein
LEPRKTKQSKWVIPSLVLGGLLIVFLGSLATPYEEKQEWRTTTGPWERAASHEIRFAPVDGRFIVRDSSEDGITILKEAGGHGLPGSALKEKFREKGLGPNGLLVEWEQRKSGLFTEIESTTKVELSTEKPVTVDIQTEGKGTLDLYLNPDQTSQVWKIRAPGRHVTIWLPTAVLPDPVNTAASLSLPNFSLSLEVPNGIIEWKPAEATESSKP